MASLISLRLKEDALQLREMVAKGVKQSEIEKAKTDMLSTIYRMLVLNLGSSSYGVRLRSQRR